MVIFISFLMFRVMMFRHLIDVIKCFSKLWQSSAVRALCDQLLKQSVSSQNTRSGQKRFVLSESKHEWGWITHASSHPQPQWRSSTPTDYYPPMPGLRTTHSVHHHLGRPCCRSPSALGICLRGLYGERSLLESPTVAIPWQMGVTATKVHMQDHISWGSA